MNPQLIVRRVLESEWPIYRELRLNALKLAPEAFTSKYADAIKLSDSEWQARVRRFAVDPKTVNLIAFLHEQPAGMVSCYITNRADMVQMWVEPFARKQKVGKALVHELKAWVKQAGENSLTAAVTKENAAALNLYEQLGFEPIPLSDAAQTRGCEIELNCQL